MWLQVLLVSATVTPAAEFLLKRFAPSAASINLNPSFQVAATIKHVAYTVTSKRKAALLEYLLKRKGSFRVRGPGTHNRLDDSGDGHKGTTWN